VSGCSKTVLSNVATHGWADSGDLAEQVVGVMRAASLPGCARQNGTDGVDQASWTPDRPQAISERRKASQP
jgi:hypothetical protein